MYDDRQNYFRGSRARSMQLATSFTLRPSDVTRSLRPLATPRTLYFFSRALRMIELLRRLSWRFVGSRKVKHVFPRSCTQKC